MTRTPRRTPTTIVWLLLMSGAGGAFYSHSTAAEQTAASARRTAAGLRAELRHAPHHPTGDAPAGSASSEAYDVERAVGRAPDTDPASPSVSQAARREQFNRTVFGPKPKAVPSRTAPHATFVPQASTPTQRAPEDLPAILPVAEPEELAPLKLALQPKPMPPERLPAPAIQVPAQLPASNAPQVIPAPEPESQVIKTPIADEDLPPFKPPMLSSIGSVSTSIAPREGGEVPRNFAALAENGASQPLAASGELPRTSAPFYSTPRVADFTHRPLYFEEKALERNGRNIGLAQPVVSFVHFFGTIPALPYKMGETPPSRPMYTGNGINLPSDHVSIRDRVRGTVTAAGTAVGLNYILP